MRNINRRDFLKATAGVAGVGLLAACSPITEAPSTGSEGEARNYTGKFVIASVATAERYAPLIAAIEEAHPGIEVEWRHLPEERFTELFAAAEIAGDQIDIMDLNGQDLRRYAVGDRLMNLSDLSYLDRFRDVGLHTYTVKDNLWALPRGGLSGFPFLYNKKVLETIGVTEELETYEDLLAVAPELQKIGVAPFTHSGKNIYLWPVWQFWAYAQTSGNKPVENTIKTLMGDMKFTDPEHVAALEILYRYAQDGMFIESVNGLEVDAAWINLNQGDAAFWFFHSSQIGTYREGDYPELDLSFVLPLRSVADSNVQRQLPGGAGNATGIYSKVAPEREAVAQSVLDLMTSDEWVKWANDIDNDPVSTNKNVQASDDPLAIKYADEAAELQFTYLDWYWPPEVTRAFQESEQALVAGSTTPDKAAQSIQKVLDGLYADGYEFES